MWVRCGNPLLYDAGLLNDDEPTLFPKPPEEPTPPKRKPTRRDERLWTGNKALLIREYLRLFLMVTRSGTYVDGFAGPHAVKQPNSWAARLALELEPKWLRNFHLFEVNGPRANMLRQLAEELQERGRSIFVYEGDFNIEVRRILRPDIIGPREPTFVLLDQYTTQCWWETVRRLAVYRTEGYRLELFYFLAEAWLDRTLAAIKTARGLEEVKRWWGGLNYGVMREVRGAARADLFARRFVDELGYAYAAPYAIFERRGGGRVMYYMIHATDHPDAPSLMDRAYDRAVIPPEVGRQAELF